MKNSIKKAMSLLLAAALVFGLVACAASGDEETKPVQLVPATQPDYSDETTTPIYTRPGEDTEATEDDVGVDNPVENPDDPGGDGNYDPDLDDPDGEQGGSSGGSADADTGDTFADGGVTSNMKGSAKNLTWGNINAFSIKSTSMSVAQMRKLCVDFFRFAKTALWTPDETIYYIRNSKGVSDSMTGGQLYGGLPYVGSSSGNIYRLMDYLDTTTGKVDMADALNLTGGELNVKALQYFGNQCANGAHVGWSRVINSISGFATMRMTKNNGYIPLGDYKYDTAKVKNWSTTYGTDECCAENGEQVMFAAYAKLKMADGLVYYTTAGHVIMAATDAYVVTKADGTIDGANSYITIIDQAQSWETATAGGKTYKYKSSVDAKVTFQQLFHSNYVPFTFGEFLGTDKVEATSVSFSHTDAAATLQQLFSGKVSSNYGITDAYIIVKDASGKEVYKHAVRNSSPWTKTLNMKKSGDNVDFWGTVPTSGSYTVEVVVQLGTGERPTVYSGQLTTNN